MHKNLSRFANISFSKALLIIALFILSILVGLLVCKPAPPSAESGKPKEADLKLYQNIVEQVHAGRGYYSVAGSEMRRMGFTAGNVVSWRMPLLACLLGKLPSIKAAQVSAVVLASATLLTWMLVFQKNGYALWQVLCGGLFMSCPVVYSLAPGTFLAHEFWAGTLIALSLALYACGWRTAAVLSGLTALFIRELSLPFACVMMLAAYQEGKRAEALAWFAGILAFAGELLIHWSIVGNLVKPDDLILSGGWIVFGGWPFILQTAQMHIFLLKVPLWLTAVIAPAALLGLAGWRGDYGSRIACIVGSYLVSFFMIGRPFNVYWGLMYVFLMPLGILHAPAALSDLWKPVRKKLLRSFCSV